MLVTSRFAHVARTVAGILVLTATACSMRVTGVVRDESTGGPIGGAVVSAEDGRNRYAMTDPAGRYSLKTDTDTTSMTVSAPTYETTSVAVPGGTRYPVVDVTIRPIARAAAAPGTDGDKLQQLREMWDRGLISADEYNATRKRILGGM